MLIPAIFITGNLIGVLFWFIDKKDTYREFWLTKAWVICGYTIIIFWLISLFGLYGNTKADLQVVDKKIELANQINQEKIEQILPILEKYPEMEREIVGNINPNNFAILGDIYPALKSNESYNAQAVIVQQNIEMIAALKNQKIDSERQLIVCRYQLWFAK